MLGYEDNGEDGTTPCHVCGRSNLFVPEDDGRPAFHSVALPERLSISVHVARRGWRHETTKSVGRLEVWVCLVVLIFGTFDTIFIAIFLYYGCVIHQEDKIFRNKYVIVKTAGGWRYLTAL